jgi:predicted ATPase
VPLHGQIEKAVGLWGKAGQRSLERSALGEAAQQFTRALDQIATLPSTSALRREQIKLQVALIMSLIHVKGWGAPETQAAVEQARLLRRSVSLPKTHYSYSQSSTVFGSETALRSMVVTSYAILRHSSSHSPTSKEQRLTSIETPGRSRGYRPNRMLRKRKHIS